MLQNASYVFFFFEKETKQNKQNEKSNIRGIESETFDV